MGVVVQDGKARQVAKHSVHGLPRAEAVPRILPRTGLYPLLVGIQVDLAAADTRGGGGRGSRGFERVGQGWFWAESTDEEAVRCPHSGGDTPTGGEDVHILLIP